MADTDEWPQPPPPPPDPTVNPTPEQRGQWAQDSIAWLAVLDAYQQACHAFFQSHGTTGG